MHRDVIAALALAASLGAHALDLQAHRGGRALRPENTLPAFANALTIGVTTLELDTNVTKDGIVVVSHDSSLNPDITRGPDGKWLERKGPAIRSLTYRELAKYDVGRLKPGTVYAGRYPDQQPVDGARVPKLSELFALVRKSRDSAVRFNIETKLTPAAPGETPAPLPFARSLLGAIRAAGMQGRVTIQSFDWRTLAIVQKEAPRIPTVYLTAQQKWLDNVGAASPEGSPWTAGVQFRDHGSVPRMVKAAGGKVWSPFFGDIDGEMVREAHALGLTVVVWTVNDVPAMERMMALGVDGIISDRPDLLRETMRRAGLPLPEPSPVTP
jgi:glycerophosphoryl diester phosphodiesterase